MIHFREKTGKGNLPKIRKLPRTLLPGRLVLQGTQREAFDAKHHLSSHELLGARCVKVLWYFCCPRPLTSGHNRKMIKTCPVFPVATAEPKKLPILPLEKVPLIIYTPLTLSVLCPPLDKGYAVGRMVAVGRTLILNSGWWRDWQNRLRLTVAY